MSPLSPMSPLFKRGLIIGGVVLLAALIIAGFARGKGERGSEAQSEASGNAPSRMRASKGPLGDEAAVVLNSMAMARAGIQTRVLGSGSSAATIRLTGVLVVDQTRVTTVQAPVAGRLTASPGGWPALGEYRAPGAVIAQVSDARPLVLARGGTVTGVSAQPGQIVQAGQELLQLTDFTQLLARIAWPPEARGTPPRRIMLTPLGAADATTPRAYTSAYLVGPAADVDSATRLPVYLYRTSGAWFGARPGAPVEALLADPGAGAAGVFVPATAVVQWEGLAWAYIQVPADRGLSRFVRRRVDTSQPVADGWLVAQSSVLGVHVGDTIVVKGAQDLLSEEFRSSLTVGD